MTSEQEATTDQLDALTGLFPRRLALGGLAALGFGTLALTSCESSGNNGGNDSNNGTLATDNKTKPATDATKAANKKVHDSLPFDQHWDFDDAKRGLLERPNTLTIKNAKGDVIWDLEEYKKYIADDKPAPDTVNPSLWRNAQLCMEYGLFEVVPDKIYQVRGYDLSNITFIKGNTG